MHDQPDTANLRDELSDKLSDVRRRPPRDWNSKRTAGHGLADPDHRGRRHRICRFERRDKPQIQELFQAIALPAVCLVSAAGNISIVMRLHAVTATQSNRGPLITAWSI
ncbi:MAG: hypothetical protein LH475_14270 [Cryobacterium sp.]|uniref:hypothetical protein n=1 Tax=Cryobacterium sp. TaxID=1926290 RepID=UPI001A2ADCB3|nr:hypothetical protein [Cryobacterium sp.]MCY7405765.1 hypothetical protein [Cryobacterium sp.]MEC5155474.1 hypothetical protein [Cryobacterium sp. CAN_C3]